MKGTTLYIIYHGPWQTDGVWRHHYAIHPDRSKIETEEASYVFTKPIRRVSSVGVFEMWGLETEKGIRYKLDTVRWSGRFEKEDAAVRIGLIDAKIAVFHSFRVAKNANWLESLAIAREIYRKARGAQRNHVLALIVREVTR